MLRPASLLLLGLIAGVVTLVVLFGDVEGFHREMDFDDRGGLEDFRAFYYPAAVEVLESGRPTPGFLYPPGFALALSPLGRLELETAESIWLGLELAATAALIALAFALTRPGPRLGAAAIFLAVTSVPLAHNLHWGQVSVFIGLLVLTAAWAESRDRRGLALLPLACAAAVKLYPLLFLVVPLARGQRVRALSGLLLAALLIVVFPALVIGPGATIDYLRTMGEQLIAGRADALEAPNAQALAPVLQRWIGLDGLAWVGVLIALAHLPLLRRVADDPPRAYALVALCLPLFVEPHWPHYFVLLPFVQLLCFTRAGGDRVTLGLTIGSCLLSNLLLLRAFTDAQAYGSSGCLLVADLLLLVALRRLR